MIILRKLDHLDLCFQFHTLFFPNVFWNKFTFVNPENLFQNEFECMKQQILLSQKTLYIPNLSEGKPEY